MKQTTEKDILFDDVTVLEATLGKRYLRATAVNANCNCSSYTSIEDDENEYSAESAGLAG